MTKDLTHFIGGKHVAGTSGRFGDVFTPMTGEISARVPLASADEVRHVVDVAKAAQPAWAAVNPQRRARVLAAFVSLINRDMDKLADVLAREHGKTVPDAKGDIQRGLRGGRSSPLGIPHLMKGEFTDGAGPWDRHAWSHAPARSACHRRHHAVQLPRHDPDVEVRAGHRLRQCLHPEAFGARPRACRCGSPN